MVEGLGVSQVFSFLAPYLHEMGVPDAERVPFVGLFSALVFVVGMPLVPLWGVWADKYSRKLVIVRSAVVEAVEEQFADWIKPNEALRRLCAIT